MNQTIQQLASGVIAADIVEVTSVRGISYAVVVRRHSEEVTTPETPFIC